MAKEEQQKSEPKAEPKAPAKAAYRILSPVKIDGKIQRSGTQKLTSADAAPLLRHKAIEPVKVEAK